MSHTAAVILLLMDHAEQTLLSHFLDQVMRKFFACIPLFYIGSDMPLGKILYAVAYHLLVFGKLKT